MAESDASRPPPGPLTTEEADRLSERFRPSWEVDVENDPPTIPRVPTRPPAASPAGATPSPPRASSPPGTTPRPAATAPVARSKGARSITEPVLAPAARQASNIVKTDPLLAPVARAAVAATTPNASVATAKTDPLLAPAARVASAAVGSAPDTQPSSRIPSSPVVSITGPTTEQRAPTLVGLSPPTRQPSSEDLDWEVPTNPLPSPFTEELSSYDTRPATHAIAAGVTETEPPMVEVEELPPESHPSGIGSKYVPKDLNAPAIVLNDDVAAAEIKQRQKLEVEHRSRRAATIIRMRAPDLPLPSSPVVADEDISFPVRKSRTGLYVGAALVLLAGSVGVGAFLQRKPSTSAAAAVATTTAIPAPTLTTPPEPAKPADPVAVAPPGATLAAVPEAKAEPAPVAAAPASVEVPAPPRAVAAAKSEPAAAQVAVPTRPKAKPAATPPSKPGSGSSTAKAGSGSSKSSGSRNVIVRDTPF